MAWCPRSLKILFPCRSVLLSVKLRTLHANQESIRLPRMKKTAKIWLPSAPHDWYWYASFPVTPDTGKGSFPTEILTIFGNIVPDRKAQGKRFFFFKNKTPDIEKLSTLVKIHFQSKVRLIKYLREVWATCQNRKMDDFLTSKLVKTAHWMRFAIIYVTPLWNRPGNKPTVFSLSSRMFYLSLLQERRK